MIPAIALLLALLAPPLQLYAAPYPSGDTTHGATIEVVLSLYSTQPTSAYTLDAPTPAGLRLLSVEQSAATVGLGEPVTVRLRYYVTAPEDGKYIRLPYTVCAGACATAETAIRVGGVKWPDAKNGSHVWLPLVRG